MSRTGGSQFRGGGRWRGADPEGFDRGAYPTWENQPGFENDVFTFARIRYDSVRESGGSSWANDYPDCDLNFSLRLKQLTAFEVNPDTKVFRVTDPELLDYPFVYMSGVGGVSFTEEEKKALRRYLLNGGFLMVDDFWTQRQWNRVRGLMESVFPKRKPRELTLKHPIFHLVYELNELPQVPSIRAWMRGDEFENWHYLYGEPRGDENPHFWGLHDDEGRLMVLMCHNNDIGDGWEREGESEEYFHRYSEKFSYPLGINIITYIMTH